MQLHILQGKSHIRKKKKPFLAGEFIVRCSLGAPPVPGCCLRRDAALDGSDVASHGES